MSFTTVMTFLCVSYIFVYAGMIAYDLFLSKEAVDMTPRWRSRRSTSATRQRRSIL